MRLSGCRAFPHQSCLSPQAVFNVVASCTAVGLTGPREGLLAAVISGANGGARGSTGVGVEDWTRVAPFLTRASHRAQFLFQNLNNIAVKHSPISDLSITCWRESSNSKSHLCSGGRCGCDCQVRSCGRLCSLGRPHTDPLCLLPHLCHYSYYPC